ncbi:protein FAM200A-like [Homarus americanus]|uniref:SCAN domain-containing protein 3-like 18 n=1 Tax=Homarus americanus TaxID=6706 RepID=A0A8J5JIY5_HOMAM|nr:protein FAM200A-like [Homarus americanus]KAG7155188.1 SCAN domain-containing protein 3-like 18 [Homarus americanus]
MSLGKCLQPKDEVIDDKMTTVVSQHLTVPQHYFNHYFPPANEEEKKKNSWIRNPFLISNLNDSDLPTQEKDTLIELYCDSEMKDFCNSRNRTDFWVAVSQKEAYEMNAGKALQFLVAFHSTYSSERGFSDLLTNKRKKRQRLGETMLSACMTVAATRNIAPRFNLLAATIQQQKSH